MVRSYPQATRPAAPQDATSPAPAAQPAESKLRFKLRDGTLTVTVFARPGAKGDESVFVIPERSYREKDADEWTATHILHEEDLLRMASLLTETYAWLRHRAMEGQADAQK